MTLGLIHQHISIVAFLRSYSTRIYILWKIVITIIILIERKRIWLWLSLRSVSLWWSKSSRAVFFSAAIVSFETWTGIAVSHNAQMKREIKRWKKRHRAELRKRNTSQRIELYMRKREKNGCDKTMQRTETEHHYGRRNRVDRKKTIRGTKCATIVTALSVFRNWNILASSVIFCSFSLAFSPFGLLRLGLTVFPFVFLFIFFCFSCSLLSSK